MTVGYTFLIEYKLIELKELIRKNMKIIRKLQ